MSKEWFEEFIYLLFVVNQCEILEDLLQDQTWKDIHLWLIYDDILSCSADRVPSQYEYHTFLIYDERFLIKERWTVLIEFRVDDSFVFFSLVTNNVCGSKSE